MSARWRIKPSEGGDIMSAKCLEMLGVVMTVLVRWEWVPVAATA